MSNSREQLPLSVVKVGQAHSKPSETLWLASSVEPVHICTQRDAFISFTDLSRVKLSGTPIAAHGRGTVVLRCLADGQSSTIRLVNTFYVPSARHNVVSLGRICRGGGRVCLCSEKIEMFFPEKQKVAAGCIDNYRCYLHASAVRYEQPCLPVGISDQQPRRLEGSAVDDLARPHAERRTLSKVDTPQGVVERAQTPTPSGSAPGELIHIALWGPHPVASIKGHHYIMSFVDDTSRWVAVHFLMDKSGVPYQIKRYLSFVKRSKGKLPKILRAENGCDYIDDALAEWCQSRGIELHIASSNGVAERWSAAMTKRIEALLSGREMLREAWPEAAMYAADLYNRTSSSASNVTPQQRWSGKRPDQSRTQEFGREVWVADPQEREVTFLGWAGVKAIRFYDAQSRSVRVSHNFRFELVDELGMGGGDSTVAASAPCSI